MIVGIDPGASTGIAYFVNGKLDSLNTIHPSEIAKNITLASRVIFEDSRLAAPPPSRWPGTWARLMPGAS